VSDALTSRLSQYRDLEAFLQAIRPHFEHGVPFGITRAPGRLDIMGGIADYSGSLVLQRPIAEATFAALQATDQQTIEIVSLAQQPGSRPRVCRVNLASLAPGGQPIAYEDAKTFYQRDEESRWAAYVVGNFLVLMRARGVRFPAGAKIVISSAIPEGKGVASSAALEVACMAAVTTAFDVSLDPKEMALLCQKAENLVAGAPCGVMDQMTAVLGSEDFLLALLCQPAEIQPPVRVPEDIAFWGLDSGERHAVGGANYEMVRAGAFMGFRMIADEEDRWGGYLANVNSLEFQGEFLPRLPAEMSGEEFLRRYSSTSDTVTRVVPDRTYKIRYPTAHPVFEHERVKAFRGLLNGPPCEERWTSLGELMSQSHASYTACGLGSRGTDIIVDFVRAEGPANGLYGARITGGGCGGTVAILGRSDAGSAVARVRERYRQALGYEPVMFSGTSNGAASFGVLRLDHLI
jgi:galactokinase